MDRLRYVLVLGYADELDKGRVNQTNSVEMIKNSLFRIFSLPVSKYDGSNGHNIQEDAKASRDGPAVSAPFEAIMVITNCLKASGIGDDMAYLSSKADRSIEQGH